MDVGHLVGEPKFLWKSLLTDLHRLLLNASSVPIGHYARVCDCLEVNPATRADSRSHDLKPQINVLCRNL